MSGVHTAQVNMPCRFVALCQNQRMAPNQRKIGKASVAAWVPEDVKAALVARAAAEGITVSDAVIKAVEEWLRKPPSAT